MGTVACALWPAIIMCSTAVPVGLGLKPQRTCRDGHWDPTMDGAGIAFASESESCQIRWQIFFALLLPGIALVQPLIDEVRHEMPVP